MFDCVITAAGASSRMGAPGGMAVLKPLLPFAGCTLVETAVHAALDASCRVILVVGNRATEVASLFDAEAHRAAKDQGRLLVVENPGWERGLLGSIQVAIAAVEGEAFFLAHADMPFVDSTAYHSLADVWTTAVQATATPTAILASHGGLRGHPVLLPSAWIPEMSTLDPRGRMWDFLVKKPMTLVETGPGALRDIDTPGDYENAVEGS